MLNVFDLLNSKIVEIVRKLGFREPSEIQNKAIPIMLKNIRKNYLLVAPTGTGKTEAALLPIINHLIEKKEKLDGIKILYITPLRALNRDIFHRFIPILAKELSLSLEIRHSDTPSSRRRLQTRNPPVFLITTPETLQALLCGPKIREALRNVEWVIIDEVHALVGNKRGCQLAVGLERLRELAPNLSIIALSATISNPEEVLQYIVGGREGIIIKADIKKQHEIMIDTVEIDIKPNFSAMGFGIKVDVEKIAKKIAEIVSVEKGKVIVFTNTRDMAELLGLYLKRYANFSYAVHHSSLSKDIRIEVEREFKRGDLKCVIATSSLELGIDIGEANLVIHVMSPRRVETAIQRIGRSGHRIKKKSRGIIIAATVDDIYESIAIMLNAEQNLIEPLKLAGEAYDVLTHQIIGIVREKYLDNNAWPTIDNVYRIIKRAWPFRNLSKSNFLRLLNFLYKRVRLIILENKRIILRRGALKYYFENLSTIPAILKYDVVDLTEKKKIGELDEKFVIDLNLGDVFLLGGISREVLEINPEKKVVYVMTSLSEARPPRWTGELLPVSFEVAKKVGELRETWRLPNKELKDYLRGLRISKSAKEYFIKIKNSYPLDKPVPNEKNIVVEIDIKKSLVIIHSTYGTNVNRTIALLLGYALSEQPHFPLVGIDSDAYRIKIQLYKTLYLHESSLIKAIENAFNTVIDQATDSFSLEKIIREIILETRLDEIKWNFIQIMRRFGIIRSDRLLLRSQIMRLISAYQGTPIIDEAIREYMYQNFDIEKTLNVLKAIDRGNINIWLTLGLSLLALQVPMMPQLIMKDVDEVVNRKYEERLLRKRIIYLCLNCGFYKNGTPRNGIKECPRCGSLRITVMKPIENGFLSLVKKAIKREKLTDTEKQKMLEAEQISRFYRAYGEVTALVIATPGIGPKHAIDILRKFTGNKRSLIETLRKREANYWRTRIFWE